MEVCKCDTKLSIGNVRIQASGQDISLQWNCTLEMSAFLLVLRYGESLSTQSDLMQVLMPLALPNEGVWAQSDGCKIYLLSKQGYQAHKGYRFKKSEIPCYPAEMNVFCVENGAIVLPHQQVSGTAIERKVFYNIKKKFLKNSYDIRIQSGDTPLADNMLQCKAGHIAFPLSTKCCNQGFTVDTSKGHAPQVLVSAEWKRYFRLIRNEGGNHA